MTFFILIRPILSLLLVLQLLMWRQGPQNFSEAKFEN